MRALRALALAFINTFGITQPSEQAANRASWFIAALLAAVLLLFFLALAVALHVLYRH